MDIKEYQEKSLRTVNTRLTYKDQLSNLCMGLCGETGEVVDYIKKGMYHGHILSNNKLIEELGDIMWYISNISNYFSLPMEKILEENIKKLEERYPEGFSEEKSINRKEYK